MPFVKIRQDDVSVLEIPRDKFLGAYQIDDPTIVEHTPETFSEIHRQVRNVLVL